jgi:hypothetical protein
MYNLSQFCVLPLPTIEIEMYFSCNIYRLVYALFKKQ